MAPAAAAVRVVILALEVMVVPVAVLALQALAVLVAAGVEVWFPAVLLPRLAVLAAGVLASLALVQMAQAAQEALAGLGVAAVQMEPPTRK